MGMPLVIKGRKSKKARKKKEEMKHSCQSVVKDRRAAEYNKKDSRDGGGIVKEAIARRHKSTINVFVYSVGASDDGENNRSPRSC